MSAHLGRALTAYVDGELDHARREQVQVHLAHCAACRTALETLRRLKSVVRAPDPAIPSDLAARLLAATAPVGHPQPVPRPHVARRSVVAHARLRRTAVGAGLAALGFGGALVLAGPPPAGPVAPVDPASNGLMIEHVSTSHEVPFAGADVLPVSATSPGR